MTTKICIVIVLWILPGCFISLQAQEDSFPVLHGKYLGQKPPRTEAVLFAKGIVSTPAYEHSAPAFSPDGNTVLWSQLQMNGPAFLLEMKRTGNTWTKPSLPSFADKNHDDMYPFFSPDGKKLFFSSRRPLPSGLPVKDMLIWVVEKTPSGWGEPLPLDSTVSKGFEYAHSVSGKGTLFFSARHNAGRGFSWKIYFSELVDGKYRQPEPLDSNINDGRYIDGPFISPDESFLIFESDRPGGMGSMDLYICFKQKEGTWSSPKNMGSKINSGFAERFAALSPDGKYLFFGSNRDETLPDIYWIDARVIDELRPNNN